MQISDEALLFFQKSPAALPLYEAFYDKMCRELDDFRVKVQKTQISFANKYNFAFFWLPFRKMKGYPDFYVIISFGLNHRLISPRIMEAVEPYPNRWTHHVAVQTEEEIDEELMTWIKLAYDFSMNK